MLRKMANLVDHKVIHGYLVALLLFAWFMLAPLSVLALMGSPLSFLLGFSGLVGLLAASTRIFLGSRFFLLSHWLRRLLVGCLAAGAMATLLAFAVLPARIYWATLIWLVGFAGILILAGSITGSGSGSNISSERTREKPRAAQLQR